MSLLHLAVTASLAVAVQTPPPAPQSAVAAGAVKFTHGMKPGDARLLEIQGTTNAAVTITVGRNKLDTKKRSTTSYRLVDSMVEPGANAWTGWRRFVKAQETTDGEVSDPELTGLDADVAFTKESELSFNTRGGRSVAKSRLVSLLAEVGGFGLELALPADLVPGQECDVDFAGLATWCFDLSGKVASAAAHVKFVGVDPKKNLARFSGDLKVEEQIDESAEDSADGVASKAAGHYEAKVEIDYDLTAKRVTRVSCKGKGHVEGDIVMIPPTHVAADSTHEATLTAVEGAAVAAALKEKPQFRDVPHLIEAAGVVVTLPSHFFRINVPNDPATRFVSSLDGDERQVGVRVQGFEEAGHPLKDETDAFGKSLADGNPGMKITETAATSALGAGRAFEFTKDGTRSLAHLFAVSDGHFLTVQFIAPDAAWAAHVKDWPRILNALKKVAAKK